MLQCHASTDRRTGPLYKEPDFFSTMCGIPTESAVTRRFARTMSICNSPAFVPSMHKRQEQRLLETLSRNYDGLISFEYSSDGMIAYTLLTEDIAFASAAVLHYAPTRLRDLGYLGARQGKRPCMSAQPRVAQIVRVAEWWKQTHPSCGPSDKIKLPNQHDVPEAAKEK